MGRFGAAAAGIAEGDYTSWSHKWTHNAPDVWDYPEPMDLFIDEKNSVVCIGWRDTDNNYRFGIYNLVDFSTIFESPAGSNYTYRASNFRFNKGFELGTSNFVGVTGEATIDSLMGGISRSIQSYILLLKSDRHTIEVWRGGSSVLWSHDIRSESAGAFVEMGLISLSGKWILVATSNGYLILYLGG